MEPLWAQLSEEDRLDIHHATRERRFARNEVVFHEGDAGDALHIVERGLFVARSSSTLGHVLTINVFRPGSVFGELGMLSPDATRAATVVALAPGRTRVLRRRDLDQLRASGTARRLDEFLLRALVERNRALTGQVIELLFTPAHRRVQRQLLRLGELGIADDTDGWIRLSQDELAMLTATTRATVNRVLRELEKRGVVELGRGRSRILDRAALAHASR